MRLAWLPIPALRFILCPKQGSLPISPCCAGNSGSRRDAEEVLYHLLPKGITVFAFDFAVRGFKVMLVAVVVAGRCL